MNSRLVYKLWLYAKPIIQTLGSEVRPRTVSESMDFSRVVGNPEVIDRCSLVLEGGGMAIQFAPEGLKLLGRMSIDSIYI